MSGPKGSLPRKHIASPISAKSNAWRTQCSCEPPTWPNALCIRGSRHTRSPVWVCPVHTLDGPVQAIPAAPVPRPARLKLRLNPDLENAIRKAGELEMEPENMYICTG